MDARTRVAAAVFLLAVVAPIAGRDSSAPLPEPEAFFAAVRERLALDSDRLDGYTYLERRVDLDISRFGKVEAGPEKLFEVYRSPVLGSTYRRLVMRDGERLSQDELLAQDRRHRASIIRRARSRENESAEDRQKRERERAEDRAKEQREIQDVIAVFEYAILGRKVWDGRPVIEVSFEPKASAKPRTRPGKVLSKARGRAWVDEVDHEVIRVEAEAFDDITFGLGVIGRIHKGASLSVSRQAVDGTWLPASFHFAGSGRTLLFRRFEVEARADYSNFRRLTPDLLPRTLAVIARGPSSPR